MPEEKTLEGFMNPDTVVGQFGVSSGMHIADFGCGTGHIAILLAQKIGKDGLLTALDILEDKLDSVRSLGKVAGLSNIETIRANLEVPGSTGLSDHSQDMVTLVNILFQSQKKTDILKEAMRVLKAGGTMIIVDWKKGAGGLGPPDNLRTDQSEMQTIATSAGFHFERTLNAGQFHYGLLYKKLTHE